MITHHSLSPLLGVALLAAANLTTHAQTWTTVFDSSRAGIAGVCGDIGTDAAGNVCAAGRYIADNGSSVAVVQRSGDGGNSWELMDQYAEPGLNYAHNRAFAAAPAGAPPDVAGHLFAGGNLNNLLPNSTYEFNTLWFIREWSRNPLTDKWEWSTADDYSALDVGETSCADILVTPSGDVFATGGGGPGWVVRKRAANASTFTTVYPDSTGQTAGGSWDMAYHPAYGVFVVGEANGIWTVRRSTNNGATWSTVDSFFPEREWTSGIANCILAAQSKIHVVGSAYNASTKKNHWVVRTSSDGGLTWSITDMAVTGTSAMAVGIVENVSTTSTNLFVCGRIAGTAGDLRWVVRKGVPGTKTVKQGKRLVMVETMTWTTIDPGYQLAAGRSAQPNAISTDAEGNLYVGGRADDDDAVPRWIVRKLPAQ